MVEETVRLAPAKINLYLEVKSKRPDGYHDIESVMQTVSVFDRLIFKKGDSKGKKSIRLSCPGTDLPCDGKNLVYRAAELIFESVGVGEYDLEIVLEKRIPTCAGLGGGSSDAATVLKSVNEIYSLGLTDTELCFMGAKLGADVPFCIMGGTAVTRGIGDVLEPCSPMPPCHIVIACAGEGVSTPWAYGLLDERCDFVSRGADAVRFAKVLETGSLAKVTDAMANVFETVVLPERETARKVKNILDDCGALRTMMSGSGPAVMGIFDSEMAAEAAAKRLFTEGIDGYICQPLASGR